MKELMKNMLIQETSKLVKEFGINLSLVTFQMIPLEETEVYFWDVYKEEYTLDEFKEIYISRLLPVITTSGMTTIRHLVKETDKGFIAKHTILMLDETYDGFIEKYNINIKKMSKFCEFLKLRIRHEIGHVLVNLRELKRFSSMDEFYDFDEIQ